MRYSLPLLLALCGCSSKASVAKPSVGKASVAVDAGSLDPYHDVRPQKFKADFERAQTQEYEQKDKRIEELK